MSKHPVPAAVIAFAALVLAGFVIPGQARAVPGGSYTFLYTGSEQTYPVAANVTGIHVELLGGAGEGCCGSSPGTPGGDAGFLEADIPLPAGTSTLYVEVGGPGTAGAGGWNGGGAGPEGGGGATDIRTVSCGDCTNGGDSTSLGSRLAVAGGGGGSSESNQGTAGSNEAPTTLCDICGVQGGLGAPGGATSQAEVTTYCQGVGDQNGEPGSSGAFGRGGAAATFLLTGPTDGGGGGGWYGGGGGGQCYDAGAVATLFGGAGGGGSSYAPTSSDTSVYSASSLLPPEAVITAPVPTATSNPTLSGGLVVGETLSEEHGQWSSTPMPVTGYTYQWERCNSSGSGCGAITGATGATYALMSADLGDTIRVAETAKNFYGSSAAPAISAASGIVGEPPSSTAPPAISGSPIEGGMLLEEHGTWTDAPISGYGYQWLRCSGGSCTAIPGAVDQFYTLTAADVDSSIEVEETASNAYGTGLPATSATTSSIELAPMKLTLLGAPTAGAAGVAVSVECQGGPGVTCVGSARLTTLERLSKGKVVRLLARSKPRSKHALIGSKTFTLGAGRRKKVVVPLNRRGRELLSRFHKIPATMTISLLDTTPHGTVAARTTITRVSKR